MLCTSNPEEIPRVGRSYILYVCMTLRACRWVPRTTTWYTLWVCLFVRACVGLYAGVCVTDSIVFALVVVFKIITSRAATTSCVKSF